MKKLLAITIITIIVIIGIVAGFYFQQKLKIPEELSPTEQLKNLGLIILKNTEFKDFSINRFSFKYPDWKKVEIDPLLIWPKEIAQKEKIVLYLTNSDGVTMLVTKREIGSEDLSRPFPLILRKVLEEERKVMEEKGGLSSHQIIR